MSELSRRLQAGFAERYQIAKELGQGGMATVFLAEDLKHRRSVAIKVLRSEVADAIGPSRFLQEITVAGRLTHPHILPMFDSGRVDDLLFYVMPLVSGESLRERIRRERSLPVEEALRITIEVAGALDYAHRQGVVHRDIKPENILLQEGHALVSDFGIARAFREEAPDPSARTQASAPRTTTGTVMGTPGYMSPEQALGSQDVDARSDLYSLACVLYEMLAGQPPFSGPTLESLLEQHLHVEPRPVRTFRKTAPEPVERALAKALAKTPADRFPTVADFVTALQAHSGSPEGLPDSPPATPGPSSSIRSLAVLPLANLSGDPRQEYFADGMTEALITMLGKVGSLRVISRTSVMAYKGTAKPVPSIAKELSVEAVVEGTVLVVGDEVRITARLISAAEDALLWSESFDRGLRDILSLQAEVARAIASAVEVRLTRTEEVQLGSQRQVDPDVYRRELQGRHAMAQRTIESLRLAVEHFQSAVALDPSYAPAHAGLAESLLLLSNYGVERPRTTHLPARDAAKRAIELDPTSHEGYVSLAAILWQYEWAWDAAEQHIRRAIELHPGSANAHHWYSVILATVRRRYDEALAENRAARALDPLSPILVTLEGWIRVFEERDDLAIDPLRQALGLAPGFVPALMFLGLSLARSGRGDEGVAQLEQAVENSGRLARALAYLGFAYGRAERTAEAEQVVTELENRAKAGYVPPYFLAVANSACGRMDRAIDWLERGFAEGDVMMRDLGVDAACEALRADERGRNVLRRMGLLASPRP